ncbi:MAG TPA: RES family NAD+ phosphorylase [Acidobacteriaceae bacterium]|nr:RES family NAD+ phosphorylase [Acidobacteriaceae bacterium]
MKAARQELSRQELSITGTHRLIPSRYSLSGTVLTQLAEEDEEDFVHDLVSLDAATNTRLQADEGLLPGISVHELVYGVSYWAIVNAAFTHASPTGGRFNTSERGAWYAGLERETSVAEISFHKLRELEEVSWSEEEVFTCDDYLADFHAEFDSLLARQSHDFAAYLEPAPIPQCYARSQLLASELIQNGSNGIIYPSVRRTGGTCLVCFRPALVYHVRRGARLEFRLKAGRRFTRSQLREVHIPN